MSSTVNMGVAPAGSYCSLFLGGFGIGVVLSADCAEDADFWEVEPSGMELLLSSNAKRTSKDAGFLRCIAAVPV